MQHIQIVIELHGIVFSVLTGLVILLERRDWGKREPVMMMALVTNILLLIGDMTQKVFNGVNTPLGMVMNRLGNIGLYFFQYLLVYVIAFYVHILSEHYDPKENGRWMVPIRVLFALLTLGLVVTQFCPCFYYFDESNSYNRGPLWAASMLLAFIIVVLTVRKIVVIRKLLEPLEYYAMLFIYVFPLIGFFIQMKFLHLSLINIGIIFSVIIVIITYEATYYRNRLAVERTLLQSRAYLLNSQIKPHFMFNCLSIISALIEEDPDAAQEALRHFSQYMRKGLNLKVSEGMIPIAEELEYADNYLYMEELRFGDKLQIRHEVDESLNFDIPFLTIQPLVENAVRHGIRKKVEGGTVTLRVFDEERRHIVEVVDDGIGFDVEEFHKNAKTLGRAHELNAAEDSNGIGLMNIQERIHLLGKGELKIQSTPGVGTVMRIELPK